MRRITFGFLVFLGIVLGTALVVPFFLNINDYKPQILAEAKRALGREVLIDGDLSLSFLPSPQLTIDKVRIVNIAGGASQDFLSVKRLRVSASLFPLFWKHLKVKSLDLDQPEIYLEKLPDGQVNWNFPSLSTPPIPLTSSAPSSSSSNFEIDFDKIKITNGRLVYQTKGQEIKIHKINTHAQIANLQGPYAVVGTLNAFDQDIKVDGKFGALGQTLGQPQDITLKVQVGEATSTLEGKMSLAPPTFKGKLKAAADPKIVKNYFSKTSPFLSGKLRMDTAVAANGEEISFNQAKFEVGSAHPTGDLNVLLKNGLQVEGSLKSLPGNGQCTFTLSLSSQGLAGNVNATVRNPKELLNWLTIETKTIPPELLGSLTFSTHYTLGDATQLKNLTLMMGDAKLHGDASWHQQKNGPFVVVDLETPKIENIFKLLGVKDPKPLGIGKLKGKLQMDATSFNLTNLKGQLGSNMSFGGDVAIDHTNVKPNIKAVLSISSVNLDVLTASREMENSPFSEGKIYLVSAKNKQNHSSSSSRWSHTPLDFSALQRFDGQFEITSSQLSQKDIVVTHPKLTAKVQNGRLDITSLTGSICGGTFRASGHLTADNSIHFHMLLQDANLKQLFAQGTSIKIVAGKLTLSSDLSTHGKSVYEMIQHLAGPVAITAKDGVINGFDLHAISQRLTNLQNLQSVLGLLNTSMKKGQTPFSSFKGDIAFKEGVGKIQSMRLIAQGGQGQASGHIDLPCYTMDIHSEFHLTEHPKLPPFHMHLTGSIDNPSRQLDTSALQKYMMENVFKNVVEKLGKGKFKPADMLDSILGGSCEPSNSNGEQPEQQDKGSALDKPEQIVKDVFKSIF